jgi:hypothetical protein
MIASCKQIKKVIKIFFYDFSLYSMHDEIDAAACCG